MKAAVLTELNKPLEILDLDFDAAPRAGEARVRVKAVGVCMSDWHYVAGDWPTKLPLVLGHEAAGVVEEVGPGPSHLSAGDHVIFSFASHCGHCRYCNTGRSVLCNGHAAPSAALPDGTTRLSLKGVPVGIMTRVGAFRECVVCSAENLVLVRKDLGWTVAAIIGCSVATGVGAVTRHARVRAGADVVVIGCGGVGLNIVQGARLAGANRIIAVDLLPNKLEYARQFGATHVIDAAAGDVVKTVRSLTRGGADYAFDAIGSQATILQIVDCLAPGGQAVMVGIPAVTTRVPIPAAAMVFQEKSLTASFYGSVQPDVDFPILADLAVAGKLDLDNLISRTYRLDDINEAFAQMRKGSVARGVIVFDA